MAKRKKKTPAPQAEAQLQDVKGKVRALELLATTDLKGFARWGLTNPEAWRAITRRASRSLAGLEKAMAAGDVDTSVYHAIRLGDELGRVHIRHFPGYPKKLSARRARKGKAKKAQAQATYDKINTRVDEYCRELGVGRSKNSLTQAREMACDSLGISMSTIYRAHKSRQKK